MQIALAIGVSGLSNQAASTKEKIEQEGHKLTENRKKSPYLCGLLLKISLCELMSDYFCEGALG
jgi:hypothetical protein